MWPGSVVGGPKSFVIIIDGCNYLIDQMQYAMDYIWVLIPRKHLVYHSKNKDLTPTELKIVEALQLYNDNENFADMHVKEFLLRMLDDEYRTDQNQADTV